LRDFDSTTEQQLIEHLHARTNATLSRGRLVSASFKSVIFDLSAAADSPSSIAL